MIIIHVVSDHARDYRGSMDLSAIPAFAALPLRVRQELEQFAVAATALEGKDVEIVGWGDADVALELVRDSAARTK
jgi:inorganic pyrophosphatase